MVVNEEVNSDAKVFKNVNVFVAAKFPEEEVADASYRNFLWENLEREEQAGEACDPPGPSQLHRRTIR